MKDNFVLKCVLAFLAVILPAIFCCICRVYLIYSYDSGIWLDSCDRVLNYLYGSLVMNAVYFLRTRCA